MREGQGQHTCVRKSASRGQYLATWNLRRRSECKEKIVKWPKYKMNKGLRTVELKGG